MIMTMETLWFRVGTSNNVHNVALFNIFFKNVSLLISYTLLDILPLNNDYEMNTRYGNFDTAHEPDMKGLCLI
jgi:hypothetical protein